MAARQTYATHVKFDPAFHFFLLPVGLVNLVFAVIYVTQHYPDHFHVGVWWSIMAATFLIAVFKMRVYTLGVQDRVIRLEERIRLAALLPPGELARSHALTPSQLIGLRFASDGELPALVSRALDENLTRKQIKQAVVQWRTDDMRL